MKTEMRELITNFPKSIHWGSSIDSPELYWPSRKLEDWKYTQLNQLKKWNLKCPADGNTQAIWEKIKSFKKLPGQSYLFFVNGKIINESTDLCSKSYELKFGKVKKEKTIKNQDEEKFHENSKLFNPTLEFKSENFVSIVAQTYSEGHGVLICKKNTLSILPKLNLICLNSKNEINPTIDPLKLTICLEDGVKVECLFHHSGEMKSAVFTDLLFEIGEDAKLNLNSVIMEDGGHGFFNLNFNLKSKSSLSNSFLVFGSHLTRLHECIKTLGQDCNIQSKISYMARNDEQVQIISEINHKMPGSNSKQIINGILKDKSRVTINGKIRISKDSQKVDSSLKNHNLLLSDFAEINTKPELEVNADDVKAAHGATVGQIDEELLFYMSSRGLNEEIARALYLRGFILGTWTDLSDEIKEFFTSKVEGYL